MSAIYGTSNYGSTSFYSNTVAVTGRYGATSLYGTATYNAPLFALVQTSKFSLETLAKNFANERGVFKFAVVRSSDPLSAASASSLEAVYKVDQIITLPKLGDLVKFEPDKIIEAETMTDNFNLIASVIGPTNTEEDFNTASSLSFENTAAALVELTNQGVLLSYQAKYENSQAVSDVAARPLYEQAGASAAAFIFSQGFRVLGGQSSGESVTLSDLFALKNYHMYLPASIYGDLKSDRRLMFQPFEVPILVSGINKDVTSAQELTLTTKGRVVEAVDLSIKVVNSASKSGTVTVYDKDSGEKFGSILYVPAKPQTTSESTVIQRIRLPIVQGRLLLKLSQKYSNVEIRILGTWG